MQSPAQKTRHQFNARMSDSISDMKFCVYLTRKALTASSLRCLFCFVLFFFWLNFLQAQVSVHRLEEFLKLGEIQPDNVIQNMPSQCKCQ